MSNQVSLTMFAKKHNIDRDELLAYLVEIGVLSDIRTITKKGLDIGIKYHYGEKAGKWPVYGKETENIIKNKQFSPLVSYRKKRRNNMILDVKNPIIDFQNEIKDLLSMDKYIARSDYMGLLDKYKKEYESLLLIKEKDLLSEYAKKLNITMSVVENFIDIYHSIMDLSKESKIFLDHNKEFIDKHLVDDKGYLDNVLKDVEPNVVLDDEQRRVVLSDEDYTLVVAGAGAGKTTTILGKVQYIIKEGLAKDDEILIISFTTKTVDELKEKINNKLKLKCKICTFHKVGYEIVRKNSSDNYKVAVDGVLYKVIEQYLKKELLNEKDDKKRNATLNNPILFFSYYIDTGYDREKTKNILDAYAKDDIETLKSYVGDYKGFDYYIKANERKTLESEFVDSIEEAEIANFLYLYKVDYTYHKFARFRIGNSLEPYQPDFYIKQGDKEFWLEHFGMLNEDLTSSAFNDKNDYEKYKSEREDKIKEHQIHRSNLLQTFHSYIDKKDRIQHLKIVLENAGIVLEKRSDEEVYRKIVKNSESKYIKRLAKLIERFIDNFKESEFKSFHEIRDVKNIRTKYFLKICEDCYNHYQEYLHSNNLVDFHDMINRSIDILQNPNRYFETEKSNEYKYIIIDEFQDISLKRFVFAKSLANSYDDKNDLVTKLSHVTNAKILAVGDDWQSIYAFSGSRPELFKKFFERMGYGLQLQITKTYRNSQELIDVAGSFVMKNEEQIKKELKSDKHISKPIVIETYDDDQKEKHKGGKYYTQAVIIKKIIEDIIKDNNVKYNSLLKILILGRYNFDASNICEKTDVFRYVDKYKGLVTADGLENIKIEFITVHKSKGLSSDYVIIANAKNETYGFPSKIEMDPVLKIVTEEDDSYEYAEERRLFYVALTRTKNKVYIAVPKNKPSKFIVQLFDSVYSKYIEKIGELNLGENNLDSKLQYRCPICNYPLKYQANRNLKQQLWVCTNDSKICNFMTNDINGKDLRILECPDCQDPKGYLIVKNGDKAHGNRPFLGCTNYVSGVQSSCHCTMTKDEFDKYMNTIKGKSKNNIIDIFHKNKNNNEKQLAAHIDVKLFEPIYKKVYKQLDKLKNNKEE